MELRKTTELNIADLNQLFATVGWMARPTECWQRVFEVSAFWISAWENNELIGFGRILEDGDFAFMLDLVVHKNYQSQGIGRTMLEEMIHELKDKEYFQIALFAGVEDGSERSEVLMKMYEKFGFKPVKNGMELTMYQCRD